jgi:hypothetical protein
MEGKVPGWGPPWCGPRGWRNWASETHTSETHDGVTQWPLDVVAHGAEHARLDVVTHRNTNDNRVLPHTLTFHNARYANGRRL